MENSKYIRTITVPEFQLWERSKETRTLLSLALEITARCNNNCIHCYINTSEKHYDPSRYELSFDQLKSIIDEAWEMGVLWILLTGGEPLLRDDFFDIYIYAKKKGILVSVFTNASLISKQHISLFKSYPPRALEITIYGVTQSIHQQVTRNNFFAATMVGINLLKQNSIPITLKAMAMKSNFVEMQDIYNFCENNSDRQVRIDAFLNLRHDRNPERNRQIQSERLSPEQIVEIDRLHKKKWSAFSKQCQVTPHITSRPVERYKMLRCGAGVNSCAVSYNGIFTLCSTLNNNDFSYDLKNGSLHEAWEKFTPEIRNRRFSSLEYINNCGRCDIANACPFCAGTADLEVGNPEAHIPYFCDIAKSRYFQIKNSI